MTENTLEPTLRAYDDLDAAERGRDWNLQRTEFYRPLATECPAEVWPQVISHALSRSVHSGDPMDLEEVAYFALRNRVVGATAAIRDALADESASASTRKALEWALARLESPPGTCGCEIDVRFDRTTPTVSVLVQESEKSDPEMWITTTTYTCSSCEHEMAARGRGRRLRKVRVQEMVEAPRRLDFSSPWRRHAHALKSRVGLRPSPR